MSPISVVLISVGFRRYEYHHYDRIYQPIMIALTPIMIVLSYYRIIFVLSPNGMISYCTTMHIIHIDGNLNSPTTSAATGITSHDDHIA
jgi:hypothetical protein